MRFPQLRPTESSPSAVQVPDEVVSSGLARTAQVPVHQPRTPPRSSQVRTPLPTTCTMLASSVPEQSHSQSSQPVASQPTHASIVNEQGPVPPQVAPTVSSATSTLSSGRQLTTPQRPHSGSQGTPARRTRTAPRSRRPRFPALREPLRPTPTPPEGTMPSINLQHQPQIPPYPPPIPPSHLQLQNNQSQTNPQSPVTSSQTTSTHNRQSSTILTTATTPSLNGTQTQSTSRMGGNVESGSTIARTASRREALSFLDSIRPIVQSQATGTTTPNRSRSERGNLRIDGGRTTRAWSHGNGRRRERTAGNGNHRANQVSNTTSRTGASQHR